jgi:hypothetical protein
LIHIVDRPVCSPGPDELGDGIDQCTDFCDFQDDPLRGQNRDPNTPAIQDSHREVLALRASGRHAAWEEAKSAHQQMEDAWRAMPAPYRFALESRGEQIRFWLACGDLERARTWADSLEQEEPLVSTLARERQEVALARVRLAESRPDQVLALLAPLVARAKATERWDQVLEMWLLQAQAYHMRKMR